MSKRALLVTLAAFAIALLYYGAFVSYGINLDDEGTILYQIERTADGQTPYTDFHIGYTPATFYVHAGLMRVFGYSVLPIRWALAIANSLSVAGLVLITAMAAPWWIAWLPGVFYMVAIPVHPGEFASFNIPYPAWYNTTFFIISMVCMARFAVSGSLLWMAAASVFAAVDFMFKPNVGLFNLAAAAFVVLAVIPMHGGSPEAWKRRLHRTWWWALWWATLAGTWLVFAGRAGLSEVGLFLLPITIAAFVAAWRALITVPTPRDPGIAPSSLLLVGTFFAVNLPWMIPVHRLLGTQQFLEKVFFIGADFEQFYFIEHPPVMMLALGVAVAGMLMAILPSLLRTLRILPDLAVWTGLAVGGLGFFILLSRALMPEGFAAAVRSEFEARIFAITLAAEWFGLILWMRSIGNDERSRRPSAILAVLVIGALGMYLQLYPRSDYMHWVTAAPLSLAVGTVVLAKVIGLWERGLSPARRTLVRAGIMVPVVATVVLRAGPALDAIFDWQAAFPGRAANVTLESERAPVWINAGRAERYRNLSALLAFVEKATSRDEAVFTFPSLDAVSFLSNRDNPTRHGYFYPRWPGHDVEAEVVADLERDPPEFVILLDDDSFFFFNAPVYYYALRDFVRRNYRPHVRYGRYLVARRRVTDAAASQDIPPPTPRPPDASDVRQELDGEGLAAIVSDLESPDRNRRVDALERAHDLMIVSYVPEIVCALRDPDMGVRERAVWALFACDDARCSRALARAVRRGRLSPRASVLALRIIGRSGEESAVVDLLATALRRRGRLPGDAATALYHLVSRQVMEPFRFLDSRDTHGEMGRLPRARGLSRTVRSSIDNKYSDPRIRIYALWATADLPAGEINGRLSYAAEAKDPEIRKLALLQLLHRSWIGGEQIEKAIELLPKEPYFVPTIILEALPKTRGWDRRLALLISEAQDPVVRSEMIWIAAMIGKGRTLRALRRSLNDPDPDIRAAAIWGLQRRGNVEAIEWIEPLRDDPEYEVRNFAARALSALQRPIP